MLNRACYATCACFSLSLKFFLDRSFRQRSHDSGLLVLRLWTCYAQMKGSHSALLCPHLRVLSFFSPTLLQRAVARVVYVKVRLAVESTRGDIWKFQFHVVRSELPEWRILLSRPRCMPVPLSKSLFHHDLLEHFVQHPQSSITEINHPIRSK